MKSNGSSKRQPKNHNAAQWLEVVYLDQQQVPLREAGWFVIRVCPCHFREPVTMAYPNKGRAEHARRVMLRVNDTNTNGDTP